jgi:hypothetical protein
MEGLLVFFQVINLLIAYKISDRLFNFLNLSQLVLTLNLSGILIASSVVQSFDNIYLTSIYIVLYSFLFNLGVIIFNVSYRGRVKLFYDYENENYIRLIRKHSLLPVLFSFIVFLIAASYFFVSKGVPLLENDLYFARKSYTEGSIIFYRIFLYAMPVISSVSVAYYLLIGNNIAKYLAIFSFLVTSLVLLMLGYKGFVLWFIVLIMMVFSLYKKSNYKHYFYLLFIGFSTALIITQATYGYEVYDAILKVFERATVTASGGYRILIEEYLPLHAGDVFEGQLQQYLTVWKFGNYSDLALNEMSLTITSVGAAIFHFGLPGLLIMPIFIGYVGQYFDCKALQYKYTPINAVFFIYMTYVLIGFTARGYIYNIFLLPILSLCITWLSFSLLVSLQNNGKFKFIRIPASFYKGLD